MARRLGMFLDTVLRRRALRRWARVADRAETLDLPRLRTERGHARQLRRQVDRVLHVADGRLSLPLIGSNAFRKPLGTDWSYRPELWRGPLHPPGAAAVESRTRIGDEVVVFHDCQVSELTLRQIRNRLEGDLAPFGLRMDVFRFDGSFLSVVIELPDSAVEGLRQRHLVRLDTIVEMEKPLEIFARLNLRYGPNTEQIVRELPLDDPEVHVEFDLAYTDVKDMRIDRMWLDLIFEDPEMNQITLRDLTLSRRPRAEL